MKKYLMGLLLLVAAVAFNACQEKSRVDELKDLVEQVAEEGGTYTEEQWEKVNDKFSKLLDKLEAYDDLTPEELNEIARLQGKYAAEAFKRHGQQFQQEIEKAGKMLEGFMDGMDEGLSGEQEEGK